MPVMVPNTQEKSRGRPSRRGGAPGNTTRYYVQTYHVTHASVESPQCGAMVNGGMATIHVMGQSIRTVGLESPCSDALERLEPHGDA